MEITSKENKLYKELKRISKSGESYIFIEGKKLLQEAIESNISFEKILVERKNGTDYLSILPEKIRHKLVFISSDLLSSLFTTVSKPSKDDLVIALAKRPSWELNDIFKTTKKGNVILLEEIQDPGNLGIVIRSALAFDSCGVVLLKGSVDPFNTKVIRASAGGVFKLPVVKINNFKEIENILKEENYKVIATSGKAGKKLTDLNLKKNNHLFLFGNEGSGLSRSLISAAGEIISIPHTKNIESLNLGIAVSIILWEAY